MTAALATPRHRALLLLDLYATVLVLAAIGMTLVFVRNFDVGAPWQQNRFSLVGTSAILAFVAAFCFQASARLWGRFNFESILTWVEMVGSWQTSRIGTGNNFTSRMNTENNVVRTEAMTLRVWRARIESVVFGKDEARQVTAMFSTEQEAKALAAQLMQFARSQSVLVAPFSGEDEKRIAALNAGERAMDAGAPHAAAAAQLHRDLETAAAHQAVGFTSAVSSGGGARRRAAQALLLGLRHRSAAGGEVLRQLRGAAAATGVSSLRPPATDHRQAASSRASNAHANPRHRRRRLPRRGDRRQRAGARPCAHGLQSRPCAQRLAGRRRSDRRRPHQRHRPAARTRVRCRDRRLRLRSGRPARERRRARLVPALLLRLEHLGLRVVHARAGARERPLAASDGIAEDDRDRARHYGPQKAACERVVAAAFGERALIVRPGLIVGPRDPTGRFSHWPWRALAGGDILVPDVTATEPIQLIDVRDLADWIVRAVEAGASGAYNATGPQDGRACGWPEVLEACVDAARRRGGAPLRFVPVGEAFLVEQGVAPWNELPLWMPTTDPEHPGFMRVDCSRAVAAGLVTRPLAETVDAVLDEFAGARRRRSAPAGKLAPARERELIAAWRERAAAAAASEAIAEASQ